MSLRRASVGTSVAGGWQRVSPNGGGIARVAAGVLLASAALTLGACEEGSSTATASGNSITVESGSEDSADATPATGDSGEVTSGGVPAGLPDLPEGARWSTLVDAPPFLMEFRERSGGPYNAAVAIDAETGEPIVVVAVEPDMEPGAKLKWAAQAVWEQQPGRFGEVWIVDADRDVIAQYLYGELEADFGERPLGLETAPLPGDGAEATTYEPGACHGVSETGGLPACGVPPTAANWMAWEDTVRATCPGLADGPVFLVGVRPPGVDPYTLVQWVIGDLTDPENTMAVLELTAGAETATLSCLAARYTGDEEFWSGVQVPVP